MSYIDGVGGAFVFSRDPERLANWYADHLRMKFEGDAKAGAFYQVFWSLDPHDPLRKLDTTFSIMRAKAPLPEPHGGAEPADMYGDQPFMVNLRVGALDALLAYLSSKGIEPIKQQDEEYGRFAWIRDADGNRVELYQPLGS